GDQLPGALAVCDLVKLHDAADAEFERRVEVEVDHARVAREHIRAAVADDDAVLARRDLAQYLHLSLEQIPVRVVPKRRRRVWRLRRDECEAAEEALPERSDSLSVRLKRRRVHSERLRAQVQD